MSTVNSASVSKPPANLTKVTLQHEDINHLSGDEFFNFLLNLYKGNGWIVSEINRGFDKYLGLSHRKSPGNLILLIKPVQSLTALSFSEVKHELTKLEKLGKECKCSQYSIICPKGFDEEAEKLTRFNLLLEDSAAIKKLSKSFNLSKVKVPYIQLFSHNKQTYKTIVDKFKSVKKVAVIQATGTGKSYLIAKILSDFSGKNRLVLAPSHYIIDQLKSVIQWEAESIQFMTYTKLMYLTQTEIQSLKPDLVVLDEFHRCGAEEWGKGIHFMLNAFPQSHVLGTSATPIRHLDHCRDMAEELFNGNVAGNLSLAHCIVKCILPMPKYVCALYTLNEETELLKERIIRSDRKEKIKSTLTGKVDAFKIDWEKTKGIPYVLKKHITSDMRSFIVFCREETRLDETESMVKEWFKKAGITKRIETYRVTYNEKQSDKNLEKFKKPAKGNVIKLLFSINMLNEGLHVDDVHGVILLRPTESPNIFYQQIGRCLKVGLNQIPVIFDFVNNFRNIRTHDFLRELDYYKKQEGGLRSESGLSDNILPDFHIIDEVREITEVFGHIEFQLDNWDDMFEDLSAYKSQYGNCNVPGQWKQNAKLSSWVFTQRQRKATLSTEKIDKLNALGFVWDVNDFLWDRRFQELKKYKERFNHTMILTEYKDEFKLLYAWISNQRMFYSKKRMAKERIVMLEEMGFDFKPSLKVDEVWENYFQRLIKYKAQFGHCNVPKSYKADKQLADWCDRLRNIYCGTMAGNLTAERIQSLEQLGFVWSWNRTEIAWEKRYQELLLFKNKHGHANVPKTAEYKDLGAWVSAQRNYYTKGILSEQRQKKLTDTGFNWTVKTDAWEKMFDELIRHKKKPGHPHETTQYPLNEKLSDWYYAQKHLVQHGLLSKERIKKLRDAGINFEFRKDSVDKEWEKNLQKLKAFQKINGHCNVPQRYEDSVLSLWVVYLRAWYKNNKLSKDKIAALKKLGFVWSRHKNLWKKGYEEFKATLKKHGSIEFTQKKFQKQYAWIRDQRLKYKQGLLSSEQIELLNKINFVWEPEIKDAWQEFYMKLIKFKETHGHCKIPANSKSHPELSNWVRKTRRQYEKNILEKEKITALELIGFTWKPRTEWHDTLEQIKVHLSSSAKDNLPPMRPEIVKWINNQKIYYRKGTLSKEQVNTLKTVGLI